MKKPPIVKLVMLACGISYISMLKAAVPVESVTSRWHDWPIVGQATLSWIWFDIYTAQLRTPTGQYQESQDVSPHPIALEITYLRAISRQELIEATQNQWRKLGIASTISQAWLANLQQIFPNLLSGDRLVYVSDGKDGEFFFYRQQEDERSIGKISDEAFNDAFLSIWLSPQTEYLMLRNQLIGVNRQ